MQCHLYQEMYFNQSSPHGTFIRLLKSLAAQWSLVTMNQEVSVALQPHKPNLSCSMSRIPTDLMHNFTCRVEASNLSCSQVIWRQQLTTTALHAQIKTWLWAICRNGWTVLPAVCSTTDPPPAVKPGPGAGCEAGPEVREMPAGTTMGCSPSSILTQLHGACQGQGLLRHRQSAGQ